MAIPVLPAVIVTWISGMLKNLFGGQKLLFTTCPVSPFAVTYWGLPLAWKRQVVYQNAPVEIMFQGLLLDLAIWFMVFLVISLIVTRYRRIGGSQS